MSRNVFVPVAVMLGLAACGSTPLGPGGSAGGAGAAGHAGAGGTGSAGATGDGGVADTKVDTSGGGCMCPTSASPVCGADNKTYDNACEAGCAGVKVVHEGACSDGGASNTITFKVVVPAGRSYCDQPVGCALPEHVRVLVAANEQEVPFSRPACLMMCSVACDGQPCPTAQCVAPQGVAFMGAQVEWNGDFYYSMSRCGMDVTCYEASHVLPGQFIARMCATPGTLTSGADGKPSCVASGPAACVDVPFSYPGSGVVTGQLP